MVHCLDSIEAMVTEDTEDMEDCTEEDCTEEVFMAVVFMVAMDSGRINYQY